MIGNKTCLCGECMFICYDFVWGLIWQSTSVNMWRLFFTTIIRIHDIFQDQCSYLVRVGVFLFRLFSWFCVHLVSCQLCFTGVPTSEITFPTLIGFLVYLNPAAPSLPWQIVVTAFVFDRLFSGLWFCLNAACLLSWAWSSSIANRFEQPQYCLVPLFCLPDWCHPCLTSASFWIASLFPCTWVWTPNLVIHNVSVLKFHFLSAVLQNQSSTDEIKIILKGNSY